MVSLDVLYYQNLSKIARPDKAKDQQRLCKVFVFLKQVSSKWKVFLSVACADAVTIGIFSIIMGCWLSGWKALPVGRIYLKVFKEDT